MTSKFVLRPYQIAALKAIKAGSDRGMMLWPFAGGQTHIARPVDERVKQMMRDLTLGIEAAVENPDDFDWLTLDSIPEGNADVSFASSAPRDYIVPPRRSTIYYHVQSALMAW